MQRICISTPTKGTLRAESVQWLLGAFVDLAPSVEVQIIQTRLPLQHARNEQVHRFLASNCTHLFMLDADCIPQPRTIERLLAYGLPFIAAPHPSIMGQETGLMALDRTEGGYTGHNPLQGLQRCDAVGCAGMLIAREVFETISAPWFVFEHGPDGRLCLGEDFYFCERLAANGYEVWADCDLAQRHVVEVVL